MDGRLTRVALETVNVEFHKWDGRRHWHWTAYDLGEDEHGRWLYAPVGTHFARGDEPSRVARSAFVKVVRPGAWWTAVFNDHPDELAVYVDIVTPATWDGHTVSWVDLDLDVARNRAGTTEVLDEDEFLEHSEQMAYPRPVIDAARSATAWVALQVESHKEPFGEVGPRWLTVGRDLVG